MPFSDDQLRLLRLRANRLIQAYAPASSPTQLLKDLCGVQAQEYPAAQLAMRVRDETLTMSAIDHARQVERSIVRSWFMRGTLHLVAAEDARWLVPFLGPVFIAADRRRSAQLGWDEERSARGLGLVREALSNQGALTRAEIAHILETAGLPYAGQAAVHLVARAAMEGILCDGPDNGRQTTYVSFEDWIGAPRPLPRETALAELARRYLAAYAPAGPLDFASWSGLKVSDARDAWRLLDNELVPVETAQGALWMLPGQTAWLEETPDRAEGVQLPVVRLLPRFDTLLLGYAKRDLFVEPAFARRINAGGGILHPALIVDGRVLGIWKTALRRSALEITVEPFEPLPAQLLPFLEREAAAIGRFLDTQAVLM